MSPLRRPYAAPVPPLPRPSVKKTGPSPWLPFPVPRGFWTTVVWPFTLTWWIVYSTFRSVFWGLGHFFANFFRYAIILALTTGLAFLVHALIVGEF